MLLMISEPDVTLMRFQFYNFWIYVRVRYVMPAQLKDRQHSAGLCCVDLIGIKEGAQVASQTVFSDTEGSLEIRLPQGRIRSLEEHTTILFTLRVS